MDVFQPGSAVVPATQVEISVSCRNLRDKDAFSKSDPMCVLKTKGFKNQSFQEIGRTEMIKDSLDPQFVKKFLVQYFFEERQLMRFEIYDVDSPSAKLDHHDFLGTFEASLGELVSAPEGTTEARLRGHGSGNFGTITIHVEEVCSNKEEITLQFSAKNLDKKDFFGKSDPFLVFYRANENNSYTVVHKTEVVKNNLNPTWRPFGVAVRTLCNGDYDRSIKIECYDWDSDGTHDLIGEFTTNLRELAKGPGSHNEYQVINHKKKAKKKSYKDSGQVTLLSSRIVPIHSFLDYIKGGMQMNFTVAIDFTASNGNPAHPTSLHYINPQQPNQYTSAITSVGEIIQDYDSDKVFPVLGFGAKLPDGSVSHEFAVNFVPNNPYCSGVGGILQAYYNCITKVQLYGPTNFAPIINHIARFAAQSVNGSNYYVLLIITDGVISDMNYTKEAIVKCSTLPMSIIIVGVGDAEFDAMDELDSDNDRLSYRGNYAERDIVQFVPFRDFIGGRCGNDMNLSKGYLAKEVLAEVPEQVVQYMKKRGIAPQKPKQNTQPGANPQAAPMGSQRGAAPPHPMGSQRGAAPPPPMGNSRGPVPPAPVGNNAQTPYPSMGQSPYPQAGGSQAPYPQTGGSQAPYPSAGGSQAPYPQTGGSQAPYPPAGGSQAPYPQTGGSQAPYPQAGGSQAPYPQAGGSQTGGSQAPYPQAGGSQTGGSQAPYPQTGGSQAPNPQTGGSQAPYPQTGGSQAPYPQTGGSQAPYPQTGGSQSPYPQAGGSQTGNSQPPYPPMGAAQPNNPPPPGVPLPKRATAPPPP